MKSDDYEYIREGCREAHALSEWAREAGLDEQGQLMAPILFCGVFTQDTRLLHSLGGFDRELARLVRERARKLRIWRGSGVVGSDWSDAAYGEWTLLLDVMAVLGQVTRRLRRGEVYYGLPPERKSGGHGHNPAV